MAATPQSTKFYDFFGPYMSATIVTTKGGLIQDRYPLWAGPIPEQAKRAAELDGSINHLCFLNQLTIDNGLGEVPRITAQLTPTYEDGITFLNSELITWGKNYLEVQFGYVGVDGVAHESDKYFGLILQPDIKIGASIEITLIAQGLGAFGMIREEGEKEFKNLSVQEIVRTLVHGPLGHEKGLSPRVNDSEILNPDTGEGQQIVTSGNPSIQSLYTKPIASFLRTGKSDLQILKEVLNNCGCTFVFAPLKGTDPDNKLGTPSKPIREKLHIFPKASIYLRQASINLTMYHVSGEIGPHVNTYPIISASSPHVGVFAPSETKALIIRGIDEASKEKIQTAYTSTIEEQRLQQSDSNKKKNLKKPTKRKSKNTSKPVKAVTETVARSSRAPVDYSPEAIAKNVLDIDDLDALNKKSFQQLEKIRTNTVFPGDPSHPDLAGRVKSEIADVALNMGVKLIIETLGVPNIVPGDTVRVTGLARYDDIYSIFNIQHVLSPSGFTTRLEMYSNAAKLLDKSGRDKTNLPANSGVPAPSISGKNIATLKQI